MFACLAPRPVVNPSARLSTAPIIIQGQWHFGVLAGAWTPRRRICGGSALWRTDGRELIQLSAQQCWVSAHDHVAGKPCAPSYSLPARRTSHTALAHWCSISRGSTFSAARSSAAAASASCAASTSRPSPSYSSRSSSIRSSYRAPSPSRAAAPSFSSSSSRSSNSSVLTNNFYIHQNRDIYLGPGVPVSPGPDLPGAASGVIVSPADASQPSQYDTNVAICVTVLFWLILLAPLLAY